MMKISKYPERESWAGLLERPVVDLAALEQRTGKIIDNVAADGDEAVRAATREFDGIDLDLLEVTEEEVREAAAQVSPELKRAVEQARRNITRFHESQLITTKVVEVAPGVKCWQKPVPISRVGLYIPGGSAPLLSTVLMLGIPAMIAGCREVILCTPPDREGKVHPAILYIAGLLGIHRVFRVGGAQAIAAMAFGTATIPAVQKIFGPGNQYVTMAKQIVSRTKVATDMPAGPSELMVIADDAADPSFIASDLLSQAEHGTDSQVLLLSDSLPLIERVADEIQRQLVSLPREEIARKALENSWAVLLRDQGEIMDMVNRYAPEHLIIATANHEAHAAQVVNAGSVFLGAYTPESAGDYASGTNHTLPTGGWAQSLSGVNMDSFFRKITFQQISREGLAGIGDSIMTLAGAETLQAHSRAVAIRLKGKGDD